MQHMCCMAYVVEKTTMHTRAWSCRYAMQTISYAMHICIALYVQSCIYALIIRHAGHVMYYRYALCTVIYVIQICLEVYLRQCTYVIRIRYIIRPAYMQCRLPDIIWIVDRPCGQNQYTDNYIILANY